jgi:hypothetical protein
LFPRTSDSADAQSLQYSKDRMATPLWHLTQDELFSFYLPSEWSHQIEPDGTQVFWHPQSGSGTLRVSSVTSNKVVDPAGTPAAEVLNKTSTIAVRKDGVAWTFYRDVPKQYDEPTLMLWWELAHFIAPKYFRIAFFSLTIFAREEEEPATTSMIDFISNCWPRNSTSSGVGVIGRSLAVTRVHDASFGKSSEYLGSACSQLASLAIK